MISSRAYSQIVPMPCQMLSGQTAKFRGDRLGRGASFSTDDVLTLQARTGVRVVLELRRQLAVARPDIAAAEERGSRVGATFEG